MFLFGVWFLANFLPHLIVFLIAGKIYYKLSFIYSILAEASIAFLNLLLPIIFLKVFSPEQASLLGSLGWHWKGYKVVVFGFLGFIFIMLVLIILNHVFKNQIISYSLPDSRPHSPLELYFLIFTLVFITPFGEETMFRGYLQAEISKNHGVVMGVLIQTLLFGLRHLPSDIYFGLMQNSPAPAWANRFAQLYIFGLTLGLIRHFANSNWASWITHELMIIFILIIGTKGK